MRLDNESPGLSCPARNNQAARSNDIRLLGGGHEQIHLAEVEVQSIYLFPLSGSWVLHSARIEGDVLELSLQIVIGSHLNLLRQFVVVVVDESQQQSTLMLVVVLQFNNENNNNNMRCQIGLLLEFVTQRLTSSQRKAWSMASKGEILKYSQKLQVT